MARLDRTTPGVYVQEISLFPPSVAEVETAIPAFVGYTEKAKDKKSNDLHMKPFRLGSMAEYREKYGSAPPVNVENVNLNGDNTVMDTEMEDQFLMYDSLRLFFANGGGDCYIVSVGNFSGSISADEITEGIQTLEKFDEPTLFVFPDATLLSADDLGDIQKEALKQSADLMDRFVICDVQDKNGIADDVATFRKKIGSNNLKYGAAYYPYLHANLGRDLRYRDIKGRVKKFSKVVIWDSMVDDEDSELTESITELNHIVDSFESLESKVNGYEGINGYEEKKAEFYERLRDEASIVQIRSAFREMIEYIYDSANNVLYAEVAGWESDDNSLYDEALKLGSVELRDELQKLFELENRANDSEDGVYTAAENPVYETKSFAWDSDPWTSFFSDKSGTNDDLFTDGDSEQKMADAEPIITRVFHSVDTAIRSVVEEAEDLERQKEQAVLQGLPVLKNVLDTLNKETSVLPPSGAIAGIYADVDRKRGVWKAPANVSLNRVLDLNRNIDAKEQSRMNVDSTAGKSVNAIRAFSGRGTMVWGARTLAGNDNEWRYISVRRFFNMVEESVKNSTHWAVFEPNDANTWVKVKGMIENYLTEKWREGAMAGASPDQAFFVKIGLGLTMTNVDILEGRMIVEIGMAVVRPAEFIILKFSHKMQEA